MHSIAKAKDEKFKVLALPELNLFAGFFAIIANVSFELFYTYSILIDLISVPESTMPAV